jgi:hypothetical protein
MRNRFPGGVKIESRRPTSPTIRWEPRLPFDSIKSVIVGVVRGDGGFQNRWWIFIVGGMLLEIAEGCQSSREVVGVNRSM